ncbi:MAG: M28 family metallopeptidase [Candidatus Limnocylindrales bacterium]
MRARPWLIALVLFCVTAACSIVGTAVPSASAPVPTPVALQSAGTAVPTTVSPTASATRAPRITACQAGARCEAIASALALIDPAKLNDHLLALTSVGSRDPRHPGHAKAVAYLKEQLNALGDYGWVISSQRTVYQGIPLENIFATLPPKGATAAPGKGILLNAHYDSVANRTPGWRPAFDPAPGADDNATGTAGLLELSRVLSLQRGLNVDGSGTYLVKQPITLAFFDGEELFFKGSAAYLASLAKPYPYQAAVNLDMVGFNPIADRLDLLWYTNASSGLRDRVIRANDTYAVGVAPLNAQFAADGNTIMDAAPFGLAGIPSIALCQRYGENDATFPGNETFHTTADTPDKITNRGLWLKATKLTLAVALELATN